MAIVQVYYPSGAYTRAPAPLSASEGETVNATVRPATAPTTPTMAAGDAATDVPDKRPMSSLAEPELLLRSNPRRIVSTPQPTLTATKSTAAKKPMPHHGRTGSEQFVG